MPNSSVYFFMIIIIGTLLVSCQQDELERKTASGYHYFLHKKAEGPTPSPGDYVYYHAQLRYEGRVQQNSRTIGSQPYYQIPLDGESSATAAGSLIAIQEVLKELTIGDSVTVDIPVGEIPGKIQGYKPGDTLFYDIVITNIKTQEVYDADRREIIQRRREKILNLKARAPMIEADLDQMAEKYRNKELSAQMQSTAHGLKYIVIEEGTGSRADTGSYATVYYAGATIQDGEVFENAFDKGSPYSFTIGQARAIKGWEIGLPKFKKGGKGYLFVPAVLAYGAEGKGSIPPGAELIFYIELDDVVRLSFSPQVEVR